MDTSDGRGLTTRQIADRLGKGIEATRLIIGKALAKGLIQRCVKVAGTSIDGKAFYAMTFELVKGDAV
jgi:transposase